MAGEEEVSELVAARRRETGRMYPCHDCKAAVCDMKKSNQKRHSIRR
jgi:hypothetical protein